MSQTAAYRILTKRQDAEIEVKRSRFLAALLPVQSEEEAKAALEAVRKMHRDARHHCFAYRIGAPKTVLERFSDDGEPQGTAGKPMLDLLRGNDLYDVIAVVTRYFGGTLLGTGGLVRAYSDALKAAIAEAKIAELKEGIRAEVKLGYERSNQLRYLSASMGLFPEQEIYTDICTFTYLMEKENFPVFEKKVSELAAGSIKAERLSDVLYYVPQSGKPMVYKMESERKPTG